MAGEVNKIIIGSGDINNKWDGNTVGLVSGIVKLAAKGIKFTIPGVIEVTIGDDGVIPANERLSIINALNKLSNKQKQEQELAKTLIALNDALDTIKDNSAYDLQKVLNTLKEKGLTLDQINKLNGKIGNDLIEASLSALSLKPEDFKVATKETIGAPSIKKDEEPVKGQLKKTADKEAIELAKTFIKLFVKKRELTGLLTYADDGVIAADEYKNLGISDKLFNLIDETMDTANTADGKITMEDIKKFNEVIAKYAEVVCGGTSEENKALAIDIYNHAKDYEMQDLETIKRTAGNIENEMGITGATSFKDLKAKINPDLHPALTVKLAALQGVKGVKDETKIGQENVKKICLFLASLPLISQLDAKYQAKLLGVKEKDKLARPFSEGINEDNILKYVRKPEEENKPEEAAKAGESGEEKKKEIEEKKEIKKEDSTKKAIKKQLEVAAVITDTVAKGIYDTYKDKLNNSKATYSDADYKKLSQLKKWAQSKKPEEIGKLLGTGADAIIKNIV